MGSKGVLEWLLEKDQPSIRYRALTELQGRTESDPDVREARRRIPTVGWAADILAERNPAGWWVTPENHFHPKYVSTYWRMLVLADLGLTRDLPAIADSVELWTRTRPVQRREPGKHLPGGLHLCVVGMSARAMIQLGYAEDPRVREGLEWIVKTADPRGGWACMGQPGHGRNIDASWKALGALASYPKAKRTAAMQRCIERCAEFYLERELHRQGGRYEPWYRFHYPVHYYYDVLVGLDLLTSLGYGEDPRMRFAIELLRSKRRPDGRWNLDAVHPDNPEGEAKYEAWYRDHPEDRPRPFALETVGAPSKMVTLRSMVVLSRVE